MLSLPEFYEQVALFTRAWIEIIRITWKKSLKLVALFTRAWIEMLLTYSTSVIKAVALFTRAWIEIQKNGII